MRQSCFRLFETASMIQHARSNDFLTAFKIARDMAWLGKPHHYTFVAEFADGERVFLPQPLYARPSPCSRLEASNFVYSRIARVSQISAVTKNPYNMGRMLYNDRCWYGDSIEQQIQDYMATAPWRWKTEYEIEGLQIWRYSDKWMKPCRFCPKPLEQHPFVEYTEGHSVRQLRQACNGEVFML